MTVCEVKVGNKTSERFTYLGSMFTRERKCDKGTERRVQQGNWTLMKSQFMEGYY